MTKKTIGIILIIGTILFAYFGYKKYAQSNNSLQIGNLELKAQQADQKNMSYILFGGAAVCLVFGGSLLLRK